MMSSEKSKGGVEAVAPNHPLHPTAAAVRLFAVQRLTGGRRR
jgi:hypothetical protein